jgi:hypothetical protein
VQGVSPPYEVRYPRFEPVEYHDLAGAEAQSA